MTGRETHKTNKDTVPSLNDLLTQQGRWGRQVTIMQAIFNKYEIDAQSRGGMK